MLRNSQDVTAKQESIENPEAATEQQVNPFALMGGMMQSMQDVAKEAESEQFKANMEKDPIGSAFGLLFMMMGGMVKGMEKAVNDAEKTVAPEPATEATAAPSSPSVAKVGMYSGSPLSSPEVERKPESAPASPRP